jgi:hypothetical protein
MSSSPMPTARNTEPNTSPRATTIHTPTSAMATPSQRRAVMRSPSSSDAAAIVTTGLSAMINEVARRQSREH